MKKIKVSDLICLNRVLLLPILYMNIEDYLNKI